MAWNRDRVRPGMRVMTPGGRELGRVVRTGEETFVVDRGEDDPRAYELRHRYVTDVHGDDIVYDLEGRVSGGAGARLSTAAAATREAPVLGGHQTSRVDLAGERTPRARQRPEPEEQDLRMALIDEEMAVEKVARESGHVRIRKEVRIEERHIIVPVRVEEVIIERIPIGREATGDIEETFRGEELDLALHEEEVRVTKRPVVREELRIRKVVRSEDRDATASLRHEDVAVDDTAHPGPFPFRRGNEGRTDRH
jgi:uncharacterized protein (TIGR02271 family)